MDEASRNTQYERAAILRDQIHAIENVSETQVTAYARPTDEDVFGLARSDGDAEVQVLFIRGTKMIGGDHFPLDGAKGEPDAEVVNGFVKQFYESSTYVPRTVLLPLEIPEKTEIEDWLSERRRGRVSLLAPRRGNKRRLIAMATDNAREALEVARLRWLTDTGKTQQALEELQEELNLPDLPASHRMLRHLGHHGRAPGRQHGRLHRRPATTARSTAASASRPSRARTTWR